MDRIVAAGLVDDLALDVEGVVGRKKARAALARGLDNPVDLVERAGLAAGVVAELVGVDVFPPDQVTVANVALGLDLAGRLIVTGLIARYHELVGGDLDTALQELQVAVLFLIVGGGAGVAGPQVECAAVLSGQPR